MVSVLTGDIVNSQHVQTKDWMSPLKSVLSEYGQHPADWQLFRGDSFQLILPQPDECFLVMLRLRAALKKNTPINARIAIGIGNVEYYSDAVTESGGSAFIRSGELFDGLRASKLNLAIRTPWTDFDDEMNLYFRFAMIVIDEWKSASAELVHLMLTQPDAKQEELAARLGIAQSSVSERKTRAHFDELMQLNSRFRKQLQTRM